MKRLILVVIGASLVIGLFAGPAFATPTQHGRFCVTYRNPDHSKQIKVCAELEQSNLDPGTWWARSESDHVSGFTEPYAVQVFTDFFSARTNTGPWCQGEAPGCSTNSTNQVFFQPLDGDQSDTAHYNITQRYCFVEAHTTALIYYNQTQFNNGAPGDAGDILSDISDTTNIGCLS